jgi:hypothetical protein
MEEVAKFFSRLSTPPRVAVNETMKPDLIGFDPNEAPTVLITPPGFAVNQTQIAIQHWETRQRFPQRRKGCFHASNVESLLRWMKDNCDDDAPVFACGAENLTYNWAKPELSLAGIGNYSSRDNAHWHDWGCKYKFPVTSAWTKWCDSSCIWQSQADFAEFIETHLYEISQWLEGDDLNEQVTQMIEALGGSSQVATPSKMYEVANGIKITVKESVEVEVNRSSGAGSLVFTEEHTGKGGRPIEIPKFFYIRIPVFFGEPEILMGVFLRYRNMGGGKVMWSYEIHAPELVVLAAFEQACDAVEGEGRTLYWGSPDRPTA